jgi:hypothetical protein
VGRFDCSWAYPVEWITTPDGKQAASVLPWDWYRKRHGGGLLGWLRWYLGDVPMSEFHAYWHERNIENDIPHYYRGQLYCG